MNNKFIYIILLVIIIAGIIISATLGFNYGLEYGEYTRITVYMTEANAVDGVREIVAESFDGKFDIAYTDEFKDTVSIRAKNISDEQITEIKSKLAEKYTFKNEEDNISIIHTAKIELFDIIKSYIFPIIISFLFIEICIIISFRKMGMVKALIEPLIQIIMINAIYISIIAIFRIPINEYIIPLGIFVYVMSILGIVANLNNKKMEV